MHFQVAQLALNPEQAGMAGYELRRIGRDALALLGKDFRVTERRGQLLESGLAPYVIATVHPSSILRARGEEDRHRELQRFVADLKKVAELLRSEGGSSREPRRAKAG